MKRSIFTFVILLLIVYIVVPAKVFSQTSYGGHGSLLNTIDEWITTGLPNVADPPHAVDATRKAYLQSDPQKPFQILVFEQSDSAVNGDVYSYLSYYKVFNSMMRMAVKAVIEAKSLSQIPSGIGVHLSMSYINSKTGDGSFWGSKVVSNQWDTYTWDFNSNPSTLDQFDIFSIDIGMGPSSKRMISQVGFYNINLYDKNNVLIWNYNLFTGVPEEKTLPADFKLEQNYPNPFNPGTAIKFQVPSSQVVTLKVYDMLGREVATLANNFYSAGEHEVRFDGSNLASGTYVYRLQAGWQSITRKMILLK